MSRKSTKENKTIYHAIREDELNLTREKASELLETISSDRLEKIEMEKAPIRPDEVLLMADKYNHPELCYNYCFQECSIGQRISHEVTLKDLTKITIEMLASLNALEEQKNRLIEIVADDKIDKSELDDFNAIQENLDHITAAADSLKLWTAKMLSNDELAE